MPSRFQEMLKEQRQNLETSRAGLMWEAEEENKLLEMVVNNVSLSDIAKDLQRTEGSIKTRLLSLICNLIDSQSLNEDDACSKYHLSHEDLETFRIKKQKRYESLQQRIKNKKNRSVQETSKSSPYTIDDVMNLLRTMKKDLDVVKNSVSR